MTIIFSLAATFTGSIAWFNTAKSQSIKANEFAIVKTESAVSGISVHNFYGLTPDGSEFGFNPTPDHSIVWDDHEGTDTTGFTMRPYTAAEPHHPVLFLFKVSGGSETIRLKTNSSYLANNEPESTVEVATYSALGTYPNGTIVKVLADETHNNVSTKYEYVVDSNPHFEMKWIQLVADNNPLSSIVMTHYFLFNDEHLLDNNSSTIKTGNIMVEDNEGNKTQEEVDYIPFASSSFTSSNQSNFVTFNNSVPVFSDSIDLYSGNTFGYTHIGIVLDYYAESLEYIYSYFLGHTVLQHNNGLTFKCDWEMEL